jgi:probable phosphoglycerate mutase
MTKIVLTRHGHVEGISPARFRGRADIPLTERGTGEAHAVAARIAQSWAAATVYTSPLQRCTATGALIAKACGCPLTVLQDLNDLDYGQLQWKTHDEAKAEFPGLLLNWFSAPQLVRFPGGESLQDLIARVSNALRFVVEHNSQETVVVVGHDNVNRALLLQLLDQPLSAYWLLSQSPCAISEIEIMGRHIRIERINDASHLQSL